MTVRNKTDSDMNDVCYYRAFDPDQSMTGGASTDNFYHTEPNGDVFVLASAVDTGLPCPTTKDEMFAAADGAFFFWAPLLDLGYTVTPTSQPVGWSSSYDFSAPEEGYHEYEDTGMSIRINLGTVPAHGERSLYFYSSLDPDSSRALENLATKQGTIAPSPVFTSANVKDEVIWYVPGDTYAPATLKSTGEPEGRIYLVTRECSSLAELATASNQFMRGQVCDATGSVTFSNIPAEQRGPLYAYYVDKDENLSRGVEFYVAPYETYTLTFDANGGAWADGSTSTNVIYTRWTRTHELEEHPAREGFQHNGWAMDPEGTVPYSFGERLPGNLTIYATWRPNSGLFIDGEDVSVGLRGNGWQYGGPLPDEPTPEGYLDTALIMTSEMTEPVEVTGTTTNSTILLYGISYFSDNIVTLNNVTIDKPSPVMLPPLYSMYSSIIELKGTNVLRAAQGGTGGLPPIAMAVAGGTCYLYGGEDGSDALFVYPGVDDYPAVMAMSGEIRIRGGTYNEYMPKEYVDADAGYVPLDNGDGTWTAVQGRCVRFNPRNGDDVFISGVRLGQPVARPPDPENGDQGLIGWFVDSACTVEWDFSQPVTENMTLYAKWGNEIKAGEFVEAEGGLARLPVRVFGPMTMYSISVDGAKLRVPAASGTGWRFQDAVIDVKTADATPVPGKNYVSVTLIVDPAAIGDRKVSEVVEEVLESMRYTRAVAEVKITGTYVGDVALREGDYFLNGHFYTLSPDCQNWNEAMQWAFNLMTSDPDRYHGFKSYPVAITSHEENDLLVNIWANAHSYKTQVWLPAIPKNITGGTITVDGTDGNRTVTVTGIPYAAEDDSWSRNGIKGSGGLYGMGERYVWMPGIPEADLPLPAETNSYGSNGYYWSSGNPENRGICYFGHPELGALWDDLGPEQWGSNPKNVWTSFKTNGGTFHLYGLAEWEPINPDAVVTVSDTAKMVPISFSANAVDVTRGGSSFASTNSLVTRGVMPTVPALSGSGMVFLGWSESAAANAPTYVTAADIAAIAPALGTAGVNLYAVWGVELGIPVKVALDDCSTLPDDGRTYTFKLNALDSFTPMPATNLVELAVPAARGEENAVGYDAEDPANPWRTLYPRGDYYYHVSQLTDGAHPGEKLDAGYWEVKLTVNPSETPRWQMTSAIYYGTVADMDENSFHIIKAIESGTYATEAAVSVEGGKTKLTLGGGTVVSVSGQEEFNTAVLKSKFEVDFTRNFRAVGSFTPPPQTIPDGTCVGFMPNDAIPTSAEVNSCGGGSLGYISNTKFAKALVLDFDPYNNGSTYGDPGYTHFTLTETGSNGYPVYGTAQHKNVASKWPTSATQYSIEYDAETKKLVFTVKLPSGDLVYNYNDPAAYFGTTTAYLFMSGVVRRGPANQYGLGSVGSPAPSLTMYFDSFNYLGQRTGYDSIPVLFVNRQEAKIVYNAWGGLFAGGEETYEAFAEDAIPPASDVTRAGNYELEGWFTSWTNGAERIETGVKLDPVVDRELWAKWTSKALPKEEEEPADEKTLDHEPTPDSTGEVLKGANKALTETDLAIPEFTSNGPDGVPYVIIERGAFTRENYDKQRERELIKAGASDEEALAKDLTSVTISTYVTNIQSYAFSGCQQLTNVTFSKTRDYVTGCKADLYIDDWAFQDSSVRTVVFPADSRVVLDYGAFADADYLEKIVFLGDVELTAKYPFVGAGKRTDGPVTIQLSAKNAADPAFVASLTNGMSAASTRIVIDQETIWGEIEPQTFGVSGQTVTLTFKVPADSPWQTVTPDTLYGFYATTPDHVVVGTGTVVHPATLTGPDADGVYTATFTLPAEAVSGFFKFCIGEPQDSAAPAQEIHVQPIGPSPMNW